MNNEEIEPQENILETSKLEYVMTIESLGQMDEYEMLFRTLYIINFKLDEIRTLIKSNFKCRDLNDKYSALIKTTNDGEERYVQ